MRDSEALVEGVGGRMADEEETADDDGGGGLTEAPLLLLIYTERGRPGKGRKDLDLECGELELWRLLLPLTWLDLVTVAVAVPVEWEGRQEKEAEEVEEETGSR